jgi:hypothetical protein
LSKPSEDAPLPLYRWPYVRNRTELGPELVLDLEEVSALVLRRQADIDAAVVDPTAATAAAATDGQVGEVDVRLLSKEISDLAALAECVIRP